MADPAYDDSLLPWWVKSLIESGKSGLEILDERASDALEWTGDVWAIVDEVSGATNHFFFLRLSNI